MDHVGEIGRSSYARNKPCDGYNVLNHGDFHTRNTVMKFNSAKRLEQFYFVGEVYSFCVVKNYDLLE